MDEIQTAGGRPRKKRVLLCCLLTAALLAGVYCLLCAAGGGETLLPNVTVSGVNLGGMTRQEAVETLTEAVAAQPSDDSRGVLFRVQAGEEEETVAVPLSSVAIDCAATVDRAWQVGHEAPFGIRGGIYLRCLLRGQTILPVYENSENLDSILTEMETALCREPTAPAWEQGQESLTLTRGLPGYTDDRESLRGEILDYLSRDELTTLSGAQPQFTVTLTQNLPETLDLAEILTQVEQDVRDAAFDKGAKTFQTEQVGITFDAAAAQTAFDALDWGESCEIPLIFTQPSVTVADLTPQLYGDVLGTCTTTISGSSNRVQNISLAASFCNGAVLLPGEEFSYNGLVGSRQASRGFLPAPAYVGGETVQEVGGGVCQGSSTIYLAALRANLEITERYPHGYITRYVPEGMDATVYYGVKDFKFKNNTPFPLKVLASVSGRTLTVQILGTKSDNITVEMTNKVTATTGYQTVYKVDESLPAGQTKVSVTPYNGYTVEVYRNLYENGVYKETRHESTSVYRSRDKVVLVSPADAAQYGL